MTRVFRTDSSTLRTYADCDLKGLLRYGLHFTRPEESAPAKAGTAVHKAIESLFRGGTKEEALNAFSNDYAAFCVEKQIPLDDRLHYDNIYKIVSTWIDENPLDSLPFVVHSDLVEIAARTLLVEDPPIEYGGRQDAIVQTRTPVVVPGGGEELPWSGLDVKTTGQMNPRWMRSFKSSFQMMGYVWLARRHGFNVNSVIILAIEMGKLPVSTRKCPAHGVPYIECGAQHMKSSVFKVEFSDAKLKQWERVATHLSLKARDLTLRYTKPELAPLALGTGTARYQVCGGCEFADFCTQDRRPEVLKSLYTHREWNPFADLSDEAVTLGFGAAKEA